MQGYGLCAFLSKFAVTSLEITTSFSLGEPFGLFMLKQDSALRAMRQSPGVISGDIKPDYSVTGKWESI